MLARIVEGKVDPLPPTVPQPLARLCTESLARETAKRPTALRFAERLEAALKVYSGAPREAPPDPRELGAAAWGAPMVVTSPEPVPEAEPVARLAPPHPSCRPLKLPIIGGSKILFDAIRLLPERFHELRLRSL